jgi:hypothetical protein
MRRTLFAIGFVILASLMLVPYQAHKNGPVTRRPFYSLGQGNVPVTQLVIQTVFACVLAAMIGNFRWRRRKKENDERSEPENAKRNYVAPSTSAQESNSNEGRQEEPGNPHDTTTPKASATTETPKKSVGRLIGGWVLIAGAANGLRKLPPGFASEDSVYKICYWGASLLFTAIGVWLMVSYWAKRPMRALLIVSVCWLLAVAAIAYTIQKSAESNKRFGNAVREFATDARHYVEAGGSPPTFEATGDAANDLFGRFMNDLSREILTWMEAMNKELNGLEENDVFEISVLTNKASLEKEARKRIESQRIIGKYRNDLPRFINACREKFASYGVSDEKEKKNMLAGFDHARSNLSHQCETLFNLLGNKEKAEFDFLSFMAGTFNEYKLKDGKISFSGATAKQRYRELTNDIEDTAREVAAFRKELLDNANASLQKLSQ